MKKILIILSLFVSYTTLNADLLNTGTTSTSATTVSQVTTSAGTTSTSGITTSTTSGTTTLSDDALNAKRSGALKIPIKNLIETTEWPLIMREFEIGMEAGHCGTGIQYAVGLKAHMVEFVGYYERVNRPLNFLFMDISLDANPVKSNTPRESNDNADTPKTQVTNAHYIKFPLLGMIFKKKLAFWCLQTGVIDIPYLSEFDMTYKYDYMNMKMIPQMIAMFSPDTLIGTIFDCVATETAAVLNGNASATDMSYDEFDTYVDSAKATRDSIEGTDSGIDSYNSENPMGTLDKVKTGTLDVVNGIRVSMYYVDGCNGFSPVGGYQDGNDPIVEAHNDFHGMSNILQGASLVVKGESVFKKQTNFSYLRTPGNRDQPLPVDTMCEPKAFPLPIPSQFGLQLAYPTVGEVKEIGQDGITTSTAKNVPGNKGVVFVLWERRDYYAFAYFCPGYKSDKQ